MNILAKRISILLFITFSATFAYAGSIKIVTEEFPPYNYVENGRITGFATDILQEALKDLHVTAPIKVLPWTRAYRIALHDSHVLIYSIVRTRQREPHFKWVEKIAQSHIYLYKLKKRQDITTTSLQQIKEKYKIGVYRDDATTQYLLSKGFAIGKHLDLAIDDRQGISKLLLGRVDFIALTDISLAYRIKKLKKEKKYRQLFRRAEIEKHMFLAYTGDLYFAFSKETPDSVVARFRHSLRRIKKSDCYRRIYNNYFTLHKKKE